MPFIVLLNSERPLAEETKQLAIELSEKYQVEVLPVNCEQLKKEDIHMIMEQVLYEFPVSRMEFFMPKWVEMLPMDNRIKKDCILCVKDLMKNIDTVKDLRNVQVDGQMSLNSE